MFGSAVISNSVTTFMTSRDGSAYMMKPSISKLTMYDGFSINRRTQNYQHREHICDVNTFLIDSERI